jgi:hypothetical protein
MPFVYSLLEPLTHEVRYIGCTKGSLSQRLSTHISRAKQGLTNVSCFDWIRELSEQGLRPKILLESEHLDSDAAYAEETRLIDMYRSKGARILNKASGGPGCSGAIRSAETRLKMGLAKKDIPKTQEHRLNLAIANGGKDFIDNTGAVYKNIHEAGEKLGIAYQNIWKVLAGKRKSAGGRTFKYIEQSSNL